MDSFKKNACNNEVFHGLSNEMLFTAAENRVWLTPWQRAKGGQVLLGSSA
jgi:hypothetical protein